MKKYIKIKTNKKVILFLIGILGIILFVTISCGSNEDSEFSLKGSTKGFKDGTIIYLKVKNEAVDSTKIENNSFLFETKFSEFPLNVEITIKEPPQYKSIWIENKPMVFDAKNTEFIRYAKIKGSETQNVKEDLYEKIKKKSYKEQIKKETEFVKNNPNSILSADLLSFYATTYGREKTKKLFNQFSLKNKKSIYGKQIKRYLKLNKDLKIGDQFADFEMKDQFNQYRKLSEFKSKVILLEFWSSWCGPCREENPNLVKTYNKFKNKGFEIFAVSVDTDKNSWTEMIEKENLSWVQVCDLKGDENLASLIYGVNSFPDNFLISKNGEIIGRNLRGEELNKKLEEIFE